MSAIIHYLSFSGPPTHPYKLYEFNNVIFLPPSNWQASINDFTELLKTDPHDGKARLYRGRAYAKLKAWNHAVEDLSAAVHLDPQNYLALYYRGCILRRWAKCLFK